MMAIFHIPHRRVCAPTFPLVVSANNVMMEPLDLGPNAGSHARVPLPDVAAQNDDVYEMGDHFSPEGLSSGNGQADPQGSSEVRGQKADGVGVVVVDRTKDVPASRDESRVSLSWYWHMPSHALWS